MRKLLIIYPHWPPSNLAGVHRSRLISNFASEFNWQVTLLTVDERHYEETLDHELTKLISPDIRVEKVDASPVVRILGKRVIGDLGIRAWWQLKRKMLDLLKSETYDFVWIPIPSWYTSLLGRIAWNKSNVPFGIDYIDPWVYQLTERDSPLTKEWWTIQVAKFLEPIAIKDANLISGVSRAYYQPALDRVFKGENQPLNVAMPYGFDPNDHSTAPNHVICPWGDDKSDYFLYAGAFLPHSEPLMNSLFSAMGELKNQKQLPEKLKFRFVGTGIRDGHSISDLAQQHGLADCIEEYPERIPFLSVQALLRRARGSLVIGSTEPHYTASKTFQCILSGNPVFAIIHAKSSAADFLQNARANDYLITWNEQAPSTFELGIQDTLRRLLHSPSQWNPDLTKLEPFSARESASILFSGIEKCLIS